jgi:tagatose-6-phosphate ketose/aldose isomerase
MNFLKLDEDSLSQAGALCTAREIAQQPKSWIRTQLLLQQQAGVIKGFLEPLRARQDLRVILTGAGSSSFIGGCLAPLMLQRLGCRVEAIPTTDLLSGPKLYLQKGVPTLLVSFSRSGNSPESVGVVKMVQQLVQECYQLVFTCNAQGGLFQHCREQPNSLSILLPSETHDQGFAMTSSFTSMMLAAWLVFCSDDSGANIVPGICQTAAGLLTSHNQALRDLAANDYSRVIYLGSNSFKALAREAALKVLELTDGSVVATFDSPLGFRHGPKAIVTKDTLVVVFMSNDSYVRRYDLDLVRELHADAIAARVIAISAQREVTLGDHLYIQQADLASDGELLFPYSICGQLYAFHRALSLGNKPDQPSKSGTVNRVVKGVTLHAL